jgi:asparagine synthase (glutamine-hydrolysing)
MGELLAHRGPDGEGWWVDGPVGLVHRRLAIVDLSEAAAQPMTTADGRLRIAYNGEIYNFPALRRELEARGARFRTRSDTEVLLAAYRAWGLACLDRLRGMFAFALWDAEARRLLLARDRIGKKPLYYHLDADGLAFASEPKAFLADPAWRPEVDLGAISHYLTYQYVPTPLSAFREVRRLPAAHALVLEEGRLATRRYWQLAYAPKHRVTAAEATEELLVRLRDAVRCRLLSDVPLGAFLSGGIDSSLVVALIAEASGAPVRTFSIGFEQARYDELGAARLVARRYATDHHEFVVGPEAAALLPRLVWHYNEPYADSSAVATYALAGLARRHVTVALTGDGGDESFAGYRRCRAHVLARRWGPVMRPLRRPLGALLGMPRGRAATAVGPARRFVDAIAESPAHRHARWIGHFAPDLKAELCTEEFRRGAAVADAVEVLERAFADGGAEETVDRALAADVATYLPDDLLVKVDIATMAHGLEARSPFLDHELMEWAARLPPGLKLRGRTPKYLCRELARRLLPPELVDRPKHGFAVPIGDWLRAELRPLLEDVLRDPRTRRRGYFHARVVDRLVDEHVRGVRAWSFQLWNLLVLELWHRAFVDARPGEVSAPAGLDAAPASVGADP